MGNKLIVQIFNNKKFINKWIRTWEIWYTFISVLGFYRIKDIIFSLELHKEVSLIITVILISFIICIGCQLVRRTVDQDYALLPLNISIMFKSCFKSSTAICLLFGYIAFYFQSIYKGSIVSDSKIYALVLITMILIYFPKLVNFSMRCFSFIKNVVIRSSK